MSKADAKPFTKTTYKGKKTIFKYKYEVDIYEYKNGAETPIDIVEVNDEAYTAEDYINDCDYSGADEEWLNMLRENEVRVYKVED